MKFYETHFEEYIKSNSNMNLHSSKFNFNNINDLNNLIIYGPPGIGKYTQALSIIKNCSSTHLKYEKKMIISYNKNIYYFKISDIHYEIDMSLLGCNSKLIWHEIYNQIVDIISSKNEKNGIIICKYFHEINSELLEIFYSYMQTLYNSSINIKYILITEDLSFLPDNILNYCLHIKYSRPSRSSYNKCFKIKLTNENDISLITNIKDIKSENIFKDIKKNINKEDNNIIEFQKILCDKIIKNILNINELKFLNLRDLLYDICIYDINIANCIIYILKTLIIKNKLDNEKLTKIITDTYGFLKLYNNNYRPIYHLEKYILYITSVVHEL
uniref:ATPase AAA-type core domain-containing protein n=1 Tax=viral metagenome TaxID=1070528 RepID=A0A6C0AY96_9ZZZZ|tara:strand:+ start:8377 stop:9363 length:987 start_codon:yes stop_codon:yes gene_type:complete